MASIWLREVPLTANQVSIWLREEPLTANHSPPSSTEEINNLSFRANSNSLASIFNDI